MPIQALPYTPHYEPPQPTKANLDWADLVAIDFARYDTPDGRAALADQAAEALRSTGFFYVVNHGLTLNQSSRVFDIADIPFSQVSPDEKATFAASMKTTGSYQGYKPRSYWHIDAGVQDQNEHYNINRDTRIKNHPEALRPFIPEIAEFAKFNHYKVLHPILKLLARGLGLHEDAFVEVHKFDAVGESYVRFMKYYPRTSEDEAKTKNVWLKGHTDFGSITILWSQPVSGLQILSPDGKWRWVRHIENALVVNAGDCLEFLSGGYYKATIHRVVQPAEDQQEQCRLGVFYFAIPDDDVRLVPFADSPVLQKSGFVSRFEDKAAPTVETWRRNRTSAYGQSTLTKGEENGVEEEVIQGVIVRHFN